jgi:hypothetical protein
MRKDTIYRWAYGGLLLFSIGLLVTQVSVPFSSGELARTANDKVNPERAAGLTASPQHGKVKSISFTQRELCFDNRCNAVIFGEGSIEQGAYQRMVDQLDRSPGVQTICFNSTGGAMNESMAMALEIRKRGLDTCALPHYPWKDRADTAGAICASGCSLAFLGGLQRFTLANSSGHTPLGIHQFRFTNTQKSNNQTAAAIQSAYAELSGLFRQLGIHHDLLEAATRVPGDSIYFLDASEALAYQAATRTAWPEKVDSSLISGATRQSRWSLVARSEVASDIGEHGLAVTLISGRETHTPFKHAYVMAFLGNQEGQHRLLLVLKAKEQSNEATAQILENSLGVQVAIGIDGEMPAVIDGERWALSEQGVTAILPLSTRRASALLEGRTLRIWSNHSDGSEVQLKALPLTVEPSDREMLRAVLGKF